MPFMADCAIWRHLSTLVAVGMGVDVRIVVSVCVGISVSVGIGIVFSVFSVLRVLFAYFLSQL